VSAKEGGPLDTNRPRNHFRPQSNARQRHGQQSRPFSAGSLVYFARHAIEPTVAYLADVRERDGSLEFPYQQPTGEKFKRRLAIRSGPAKVLQPKGVPLCVWWPKGRRLNGRAILLCYGEAGALAAMSAFWRRAGVDLTRDYLVAAVPGTSLPVARLRDELVAVEASEVVLAFDADDAGRAYTRTVAEALEAEAIAVTTMRLPDGMGLAEWLSDAGNTPSMFLVALVGAAGVSW